MFALLYIRYMYVHVDEITVSCLLEWDFSAELPQCGSENTTLEQETGHSDKDWLH